MPTGLNLYAADLFTAHAQSLLQEQRAEWRLQRSLGLAGALRAEAALAGMDRSGALVLFEEAGEHCLAARRPAATLPFGLGEAEGETWFYSGSSNLRLGWLGIESYFPAALVFCHK